MKNLGLEVAAATGTPAPAFRSSAMVTTTSRSSSSSSTCSTPTSSACPPSTKRTVELGSKHSSDFVCSPFKHILGDYIEGLERFRAIPCHKPDNPVRVGLVGEYFTAIDALQREKPASKRLGLHHVRHGTDIKHDHCRHAEVRARGLRRRHPYEILWLHARD